MLIIRIVSVLVRLRALVTAFGIRLCERRADFWRVVAGPSRVAILVALLSGSTVTQAAVYRVKAGASSNGPGTAPDWSDAFNDLQDALAEATTPGDQIWVSSGTYKPGTNRSDTFSLTVNGVAVLGGFDGDETDPMDRNPNPQTNGTILSGDIDSDNVLDNDNSYHVVTIGSNVGTTTAMGFLGNWDGFTIKMGSATGETGNQNRGGGIFIDQSSPRIRNCIITQCTADFTGGGIECAGTSTPPEIRSCKFIGNTATGPQGRGGGLNTNRSVTVINTLFEDNYAGKWGGAMNVEYNLPLIEGVDEDIILVNCQFVTNTCPKSGGALYLATDGDLEMTNCLFNANESLTQGFGGAVWTGGIDLNTHATNCTFVHNKVHSGTGGAWAEYTFGAFANITNCIFYDNAAPNQIDIETGGLAPNIMYTAMQQTVIGATNIQLHPTANPPGFVDNTQSDPAQNDYRLACGSICINKGLISAMPADAQDVDENQSTTEKTRDLDFALRIIGFEDVDGLAVDMGAYEKQPTSPCNIGDIMPLPCRNSVVDVDDLLAVINSWGSCTDPNNCPADITGPSGPNDVVDVDDLLAVINNWGPCTGFTGDADMPQSVGDCMDLADARCPGDEACWVGTFDRCVTALCEAQVINCED